MKQFKYALAKRGKTICPQCRKKTFVLYLETETQNVVSEKYGRCDRESSCGYHAKPEHNDVIFIPKFEELKKQTSYISLKYLDSIFMKTKSNYFTDFLFSKFSGQQVNKAINNYFISTEKENKVVFWQIDELERVRTGKIMLYNPKTGKRVKNAANAINWVHKQPYELKQCLFGLHLIKEFVNKTIAIVESEKTAVIMSIFEPDYLWLATGSKSGFKYEYIKAIKYRNIIAFPDKEEFQDWSKKAEEMNKFGYKITVSEQIEKTNYEQGTDIADIYLIENA